MSTKPNSSAVETTANATIDELRTLILEAEQALVNAGDSADEKLVEIRDRLKNVLEESRSTFGKLKNNALSQVKKADDVVRSHPYETIGVALGIGLIIGLLLPKR